MNSPKAKQEQPKAPTDPQVRLAVEQLMNRPLLSVADAELEPEVHDAFAREAIEVFKRSMKGEE
jgi:hypothetical protein